MKLQFDRDATWHARGALDAPADLTPHGGTASDRPGRPANSSAPFSSAPFLRGASLLKGTSVALAGLAGLCAWALAAGAGGLEAALQAGVAVVRAAADVSLLAGVATLAAGAVAGFLAGLLGIGGSLVVVPALYLLLGGYGVAAADVPHAAVATALVAMLPSALCCTVVQHRRGRLDLPWLRRLLPCTAAGAAAGALGALFLQGPVLAALFVAQSCYYGIGMLRRPPPPYSWRGRVAGLCARIPCTGAGSATGLFCAGLGMGAGSLVVPYLMLHGVSLLRASASATAVNLCIAASGALTLVLMSGDAGALSGSGVCWPAAAALALGATLAAPLGVAAAPRLPLPLFRRALGIVNLLGAAVLLVRTF